MQQGIDPRVPKKDPKPSIICPYHPKFAGSSGNTCAKEGYKINKPLSSRKRIGEIRYLKI